MTYLIDWYIENEILYIKYSESINAEELQTSMEDIMSHIDSSPRSLVHIITNIGEMTGMIDIKDLLPLVRNNGTHERLGWFITLRENTMLVKMGIAFATTIFKTRTRSFDCVDDAVEFLKTMDSTLHWENINPSLNIR